MVDIQSTAAEIRRGIKKEEEEDRKKSQGKNIMVCPTTLGDHNQPCVAYNMQLNEKQSTTRMWANAQRDGRPAEHSYCMYRSYPLFNASKFG